MPKPSIIIFTGADDDFIQALWAKKLNVIGIAVMKRPVSYKQKLLQPVRWLYRRLMYDKVLPNIKSFAAKNSIEYFEYDHSCQKNMCSWLARLSPEILLLYHVPILNKDLLDIATIATMNLHPTLLPKYRGGHPLLWMAKDFDLCGGVSLHLVTENVDCGDIIGQRSFNIPVGASISEVEALAIDEHGVALVEEAIQAVEENRLEVTSQAQQSPTPYARRLAAEEFWRLLEWQKWPIEHCWHYLRGEDFWLTQIKGKDYFNESHLYSIGNYQIMPIEGEAGTIDRDQQGLFFIHPDGKIRILQQVRWRVYWDKLCKKWQH